MTDKEQLEYLMKIGYDRKTAFEIMRENKGYTEQESTSEYLGRYFSQEEAEKVSEYNKGEKQEKRASTWVSYDAKTGEPFLEATGAAPKKAQEKYQGSKFWNFFSGKHFLCRSGLNAKKEVAKYVIPLALVVSAYVVKNAQSDETKPPQAIEQIEQKKELSDIDRVDLIYEAYSKNISSAKEVEEYIAKKTGKFSDLEAKKKDTLTPTAKTPEVKKVQPQPETKQKTAPEVKKPETKPKAPPAPKAKEAPKQTVPAKYSEILKLSSNDIDSLLKSMNVPEEVLYLSYGKNGTDIVRKQVFAALLGPYKDSSIKDIFPLLKKAEGYEAALYLDTGPYQVPTIGYGTTAVVYGKKGWTARPLSELKEMAKIGEFKMGDKPMNDAQLKALHGDLQKLSSIMFDLTCMLKAKKVVGGDEDKRSQKEKDRAYILQKTTKLGISPLITKLKKDMHDIINIPTTKEEQEAGAEATKPNPNFQFTTNEKASIELAHAFLTPLLATSIQKAKKANSNYEFNPEKDFKNPMFLVIVSQAFQKGNAVDSTLIKHFANDDAGSFFHYLLCEMKTKTPGRTVKEVLELLDTKGLSNKHLLSIQTALHTKKASFENGFAKHKDVAAVVIGATKAKSFNHASITKQIDTTVGSLKLVNATLLKLKESKKTI